MKTEDILNSIEKMINDMLNAIDDSEISEIEDKTAIENNSKKTGFKEILYSTMRLFLTILKTPFKIVARYLKYEIITAIKKDLKLYILIIGLMGVLFVFFSVVWLFISAAVAVYFFDKGYTVFLSIVYSIGIQIISFILISLLAFILSKKLRSLKILKNIIK